MTDDILTYQAQTVGPRPVFPMTVTVGDASIKLKADGSWEGDGAKWLAAVEKHKSFPHQSNVDIWFVTAIIRLTPKPG